MKFKNLFMLCILVLILTPKTSFSQEEKKVEKSVYNLDGVFSGGGGKYYLRQLDNEILWYGEEDAVSPTWSNVAHGIIKGNTLPLNGQMFLKERLCKVVVLLSKLIQTMNWY